MLRYRVGCGGGMDLANYYKKSEHIPQMQNTMATYYAGAKDHAEIGVAAMARPNLHPAVQKGLGIDPSVPLTTKQLAHLLDGKRADGEPIEGKAATKNSFIDFTFSAPKSFSVALVYASPQERVLLEKAYSDAVNSLMDVISATIGTASVGKTSGNRASNRQQAHIAMVPIEHYTARPTYQLARGNDTEAVEILVPGDPQRHTHILTFNAAFVADTGRVTSLYQEGIQQRTVEFGTIGQAFLAANLRKLGVDVELDSTPGLTFNDRMARLTAIPRDLCDLHSKRHNDGVGEAHKLAASKGRDFDTMTPDEKADLLTSGIRRTRESKVVGLNEYESWMEQGRSIGYKHRSVLRPDEKRELAPAAVRYKQAYDVSLPLIESQFENRAVIEGSIPRVAAAKGLIAAGIESASEVSIITAAYRSEGVKQDGKDTTVHWAFDTDKRYARVTTQLSVELESEAIALLKTAAADKSVAYSQAEIERATAKVVADAAAHGKTIDFTSTHGRKQLEFATRIAASGRSAVGIGVAGSGKSVAMRIPVEAAHARGRDTMGVTMAWRQTEGLKDAGIGMRFKRQRRQWEPVKDTLVDMGIRADHTFSLAKFKNGIEKGTIKTTTNTTLYVDEVGLLGTQDILDLARLQKDHGFQLIMIGDDGQCQSIRAGAPVDLCRRAFGSENVPELLDSIRQENIEERETVLMWRAGNATEALKRKDANGDVHIVPGGYPETINAVVDRWFELTTQNVDDSNYALGINVKTNADSRAIGEEIHARRQRNGEIGQDICSIDAKDQGGDEYTLNLAAGDRVRMFDRVVGTGGVVGNNGSVVEVVSATANHLTVRKRNGQTAQIDWDDLREDAYERRQLRREGLPPKPREGFRIRLSRGDAVTVNARQSETITQTLTVMPSGSAAFTAFDIYTSDSRHVKRGEIYVSQGAEKQEVEGRRSLGHPDNRETNPEKIKAAILENMARNLSRQPKKTLALDFLDHSIGLRSGTLDARLAAWHRQETNEPRPVPPLSPDAKIAAKVPPDVPTDDITPSFEAERFGPPVESSPDSVTSVKPQTRAPMSPADVQTEFAHALEREGFRLKGAPVMDGRWHRVAVDGDKGKQKSGSYRGWDRGGIMNNFRGGEPITWHPDVPTTPMSAEQRAIQRAADRDARLQAQAERLAKEEKVAADAETVWKAAKPAHAEHVYLKRKQIDGRGLKQGAAGQTVPMTDGHEMKIGGKLLVPLRDEDGKLWNIQIIDKDGGKLFLPGRKKGLSFTNGDLKPNKPVLIAEGVATAKTLFNTTSLTTVSAIDSGNILSVAAGIRSKYPETPIIFAADNDHHLPRKERPLPNVGIEKATDAARHVGGVVIVPQFPADDRGTDWNDVFVDRGRDVVRKQIDAAFAQQGISELLPTVKEVRAEAWNATQSRSDAVIQRDVQKPNYTQGI